MRDRKIEISEYKEFELYVAYLYESLGFRVERNLVLGGQEVDILAVRFIPGLGDVRILVECKWRSKGSVSNQEVFDFQSVVGSLRNKHLITRGVMVTNRKFSEDALSIAYTIDDIELLTIGTLENQLFDLRQVFKSFLDTYERSAIFTSYIPLRAKWYNASEEISHDCANIEKLLDEWMKDSDVSLVSILADYGSGKTTLLERIKYLYVNRYLLGESRQIPLFVPLKRFSSHGNLDDFLRYVLVSELEREIPLVVFWRVLREGGFLMLLDGFDEMTAAVDAETRRDNILLLSPLFRHKAKVILTCRPSYFVSTLEHNRLVASNNKLNASISLTSSPQAAGLLQKSESLRTHLLSRIVGHEPLPKLEESTTNVVNLASLDEDQIDSFLSRCDPDYRSRCNCGWKEVKAFLFGVYDLRDLMTRPILLTLINETILAGKIGINSAIESIGPSSLYEIYTSMKLDLDWLKGETRQLISKEDRAIFAETLALAMFRSERPEVSYSSLLELAKQGLGLPVGRRYLEKIKPAVFASDLQVCTFLTRSDDQVFRFSHRSFMEFFVALHLKKRILAGERFHATWDLLLPKEVLYFLGSFAIPDPRIREVLLNWHRHPEAPRRTKESHFYRNVAGTLLYSGPNQQDLNLENIWLSRVDLKRTSFLRSAWKAVRFSYSEWRDIRMSHVRIQDLALENVGAETWNIDRSNVAIEIDEGRLSRFTCVETNIVLRTKSAEIVNSEFEKGEIDLAGEITIDDSVFIDLALEVDGSIGNGAVFRECKFVESTMLFHNKNVVRIRIEDSDVLGCTLFGFRLSLSEMRLVRFEECEGILVVRDGGANLPEMEDNINKNNNFILADEESWNDIVKRKLLVQSFEPRLALARRKMANIRRKLADIDF